MRMYDVVVWRGDDAPTLTPLQREMVAMIVNGLPNRAIAARLGISPGCVGTQVGRIVQRLGLSRRSEIVAWGCVGAPAWSFWPELRYADNEGR